MLCLAIGPPCGPDPRWEEAPSRGSLFYQRLHLVTVPRLRKSRGCLSIVRLNSADLSNAHLSVVNLNKANLRMADLYKANPSEDKLLETDLSEAYLQYANLSEANLGEARNLTREQIDEAYGDKRTEPPQHMRHPKHWCNNTDYKSNEEYKYLDARKRVPLGSCRSLLDARMRMCVNATCGESSRKE
jgi:uncharacterized protein YjbI with pentapeptide repeats